MPPRRSTVARAGGPLIFAASVLILTVLLWKTFRPGSRPPTLATRTTAANRFTPAPDRETDRVPLDSVAHISANVFIRGRTGGDHDTQPPRPTQLDAYSLDVCEVTNARFARFVAKTGYRTQAEQAGFGRVFVQQRRRTIEVPGADWRHPEGPGSTIVGRELLPVVQVSWNDAVAFAEWEEKRLPTEAEWECAARGGLADYDYPWRAESVEHRGLWIGNLWQGRFPQRPESQDGFPRLAPVARFPKNPLGLYDMAGNVREWCVDRYAEDAYQTAPRENPRGPETGEPRVVRGGSWQSTAESRDATVWKRAALSADWWDDQTGFRCAADR